MIAEIFLPEIFRGRRLLSKKIVGISINHSMVRMVQLTASGKKPTIQSVHEEQIMVSPLDPSYAENVSSILKSVFSHAKNPDYIRIAIPTSMIIFKEVKIPLKDPDKIDLVIDHEVESMLPFPLNETVMDFVVTRQKKDEDFSRVLVAAARKQDLEQFIKIFTGAGINPTHITAELLALYNIYQHIPDYSSIKDGSAIIDVGLTSTRIAFIQDGELRLIRNIPKGFETLVNNINQETKHPHEKIKQHLHDRSLKATSNDPNDTVVQKHVINFLNDIQFTLNSFSLKLNFYKDIQKILFIGVESTIKDLTQFASDVLQTPCELFDTQKLFSQKIISSKIKETPSWNTYTPTLGIALPPLSNFEFDFSKRILKRSEHKLLMKQIITACSLILIMMIAISVNGYLNLRFLNNRASAIEEKEVSNLRNMLIKGKRNTQDETLVRLMSRALNDRRLSSLFKKTKTIVGEEERSWLALANLRVHPLKTLIELTKMFDRETFNVYFNYASINNDVNGLDTVDITGVLKSKTEGEDFQDYYKFIQKITDRIEKKLVLSSEDSLLNEEPEGGVKFSITLKQKEQVRS